MKDELTGYRVGIVEPGLQVSSLHDDWLPQLESSDPTLFHCMGSEDVQCFATLDLKEKKTTKIEQEAEEQLQEVLYHDLALLHCPQKNGEKDGIAY